METTIDPVRELIKTTLHQRHLNMSAVSKKLGKNHAYLHQFLDRGIPARLPETVREQLAVILEVPEEQLRGSGAVARVTRVGRAGTLVSSGDKIPVLGAGQGGPDGWFPWNGEIVDYIFRIFIEFRISVQGVHIAVIGNLNQFVVFQFLQFF